MRERLEKLLAQGRDGALLRFGLGQACLQAGDAQAAARHLREAVVQDPRYSAAWKLLGKALRQLERAGEAGEAWRQGLVVAQERGDAQSAKEIQVFLKRLAREHPGAVSAGASAVADEGAPGSATTQ